GTPTRRFAATSPIEGEVKRGIATRLAAVTLPHAIGASTDDFQKYSAACRVEAGLSVLGSQISMNRTQR
ncbi:hypothetical protein, partial [Mesorhizobium sp.]